MKINILNCNIYLYIVNFMKLCFSVFLYTWVLFGFFVWKNDFMNSHSTVDQYLLSPRPFLFYLFAYRGWGREIDAWLMARFVICKEIKRCEPMHCQCFWYFSKIMLIIEKYVLIFIFSPVLVMSVFSFFTNVLSLICIQICVRICVRICAS